MVNPSEDLDKAQTIKTDRCTVTRLNWAGLGVVEASGKSRCVPFTRVGETVEVKWHDAGWGRLIGERIDDEKCGSDLDERSACPQARRCTGCSMRHLTVEEQRKAQEESHLGALRRLSGRGLEELKVHWLESPPRDGYRTRVTARLSQREGGAWYLGLRSHWGAPIDLSRCPNHPEVLRAMVSQINRWLSEHAENLGLSNHEERSEADDFALVRVSVQSGANLPTWVVFHAEDHSFKGSVKREKRQRRLLEGEEWIKTLPIQTLEFSDREVGIYAELSLRDQSRTSTGVIKLSHLAALGWRCERGHHFAARPPAWLPQSPSTLESLRSTVERCLWDDHDAQPLESRAADYSVFELGCGVGVIGIALAKTHSSLIWYGVDIESSAVECANESAQYNGVADRVRFVTIDGRRGLAESSEVTHLVIHAMRKPLSGLLALAAHKGIRRLCYLAPSAPALARDLAEASEYRLDRLFFIDQMPGTAQSMTIAQLTLAEKK